MIVATNPDIDTDVDENLGALHAADPDRPWQTLVWNDPVNLMSYVAHVFREYFGYPREVAEHLMMTVHTAGKAVVAEGPREQMELHAQVMHDYGLWATIRQAPSA
jgi:ATP-dependent Clp protease adaptor protein ClpS